MHTSVDVPATELLVGHHYKQVNGAVGLGLWRKKSNLNNFVIMHYTIKLVEGLKKLFNWRKMTTILFQLF